MSIRDVASIDLPNGATIATVEITEPIIQLGRDVGAEHHLRYEVSCTSGLCASADVRSEWGAICDTAGEAAEYAATHPEHAQADDSE